MDSLKPFNPLFPKVKQSKYKKDLDTTGGGVAKYILCCVNKINLCSKDKSPNQIPHQKRLEQNIKHIEVFLEKQSKNSVFHHINPLKKSLEL